MLFFAWLASSPLLERDALRRVHPNRPLPVMPQDEGVEPRPVLVRIEDTKRFRCCYCDEIKHRTWIIRHIRDAHPNQREPLFPPPLGDRRIVTREAASNTSRVLLTGSLRCPVCDTVVMRQAMTRHMNTHTEADRRQLPQYHHERVRARRRVEVVLDHGCPHCGVRVSSERALRNHVASQHPTVYQPATSPGQDSEKPYRCATCPQRYHSRAGLGYHVHCLHPHHTRGFFTRPDGTEVPVFIAPKRLLCPRCGSQFMNELTLFRHNAVIHEHRVIPKEAPWYREEPHAETAEHLLVCPALRASRELFGIDKLRRKELVRNDKLARWLSHVFHLQSPVLLANPPD